MKATIALCAIMALGVLISGAALASPDAETDPNVVTLTGGGTAMASVMGSGLGLQRGQFSPVVRVKKCLKQNSPCGPGSVCCGKLICQEFSPDLGGGWECQPRKGP